MPCMSFCNILFWFTQIQFIHFNSCVSIIIRGLDCKQQKVTLVTLTRGGFKEKDVERLTDETDKKSEEIGQPGERSGSWHHSCNLIEGSVASYLAGTSGLCLSPGWHQGQHHRTTHVTQAGVAKVWGSPLGVPCFWHRRPMLHHSRHGHPCWRRTLDRGRWAVPPSSLVLPGARCHCSLLHSGFLCVLSFLQHCYTLRTEHWIRLSICSHGAYILEAR